MDHSRQSVVIPASNFFDHTGQQDCYLNEDGSELVVPFNIVETMAVLTKCSFDENHRQPISNLGGIPAIADLIQVSFVLLYSGNRL